MQVAILSGLVWALYGYALFVSIINLLLMRRPKSGQSGPAFTVLIPARNEAENLERLIPTLIGQGLQVLVFDDESDDGTGEVAAKHGATVIRPSEPLPFGWTGKNRACHELAKAASEASPNEWWVFLDADVQPTSVFGDTIGSLIASCGAKYPVISGFPKGIPGKGLEPVYLSWVSWILLATNPFGLISRSGMAHPRFTNGQITVWRATTYTSLWPNERLKGRILEDVLIGRLLAKEGIRVEVADLTSALGVKMYDTLKQAYDGMSKNTYEITGSVFGSLLLAVVFIIFGFGWLALGPAWWVGLAAILFSKLIADFLMRGPLWVWPFMPITCLMGAATCMRSIVWHRRGRVEWKGRVYPGN